MAIGLCLLLPGAWAHNTSGGRNGLSNGVSGNYVGPAAFAFADSDAPVGEKQYADTLVPLYAMVCNLESMDGFLLDETRVDSGLTPSGQTPDGTWDDGGYGGACHPRSETPGCPAASAVALDAVLQDEVFIVAACDWKTVEGGTPQTLTFTVCMANSILQSQPLNTVGCTLSYAACLGNPTSCTVDGTESCGSDGISDGLNYGEGGGSAGPGVPYPTAAADQGDIALGLAPSGACLASDASAGVYVIDGVDTFDEIPELYGVTTGWIDDIAAPVPPSSPGSAPSRPSGQTMGH